MKWSTRPDGYLKKFAFFPTKIGESWVWLETYYSMFCGTHFQVLTKENYESGMR